MTILKTYSFFQLISIFVFLLYQFSYSSQANAESGAKSMFADDASSVIMSSDEKLNSNVVKVSKKNLNHQPQYQMR